MPGSSFVIRTRRSFTFALAAAAVMLAGAAEAQTKIRFALDWRFEGPAAPFALALDKGYFAAEGLDVQIDPGNGSREAITRVASGTYDIGFGDINSLVRFKDENPASDVKGVMMIYDKPPFSIVGRKSKGITADVKSLEGKKFGAPAPDGAYAQWPIFKAVTKVDDSKMTFENVGFPVREPMLAQGQVDAIFGFSFSSAINLMSRGTPAEDVVVLLMADYGLELYGNALMVSDKFAKENPEAIKKFIRAVLKGVKDTAKDPASAVDSVIKRNDVAKKETELARLKMALEQNFLTKAVKEDGFGTIRPARFEKAIEQIGLIAPFKNKPKVEDVFTTAYLPPAAELKMD